MHESRSEQAILIRKIRVWGELVLLLYWSSFILRMCFSFLGIIKTHRNIFKEWFRINELGYFWVELSYMLFVAIFINECIAMIINAKTAKIIQYFINSLYQLHFLIVYSLFNKEFTILLLSCRLKSSMQGVYHIELVRAKIGL